MTAQELYEKNLVDPSDIGAHLSYMMSLAMECQRICEFGVRGGVSTSVWLASKPKVLRCYDIAVPGMLHEFEAMAKENGIDFLFTRADTSKLDRIEDCDLLFLDTLHTHDQLKAELSHHFRVIRFIVMHDTYTNAWRGEGADGLGLRHALIDFLLAQPNWKIKSHTDACSGLTVFQRT